MIWSMEQTLHLIDSFRLTPALWDSSLKEYRDKETKKAEIIRLAQLYTTTVEEITKKIKSIRTQFRREHKKILEKRKDGTSGRSRWFGYEHLVFLLSTYDNFDDDLNETLFGDEEKVEYSEPEEGNHFMSNIITSNLDPAVTKVEEQQDEIPDNYHEVEQYPEGLPPEISISIGEPEWKRKRLKREADWSDEVVKKNGQEGNAVDREVEQGSVEANFLDVSSNQTIVQSRRNESGRRNASRRDRIYSEANSSLRDHYSIYGEYVGSRLRNAGQNQTSTAIAKHHIDNILFCLEMGLYNIDSSEPRHSPNIYVGESHFTDTKQHLAELTKLHFPNHDTSHRD